MISRFYDNLETYLQPNKILTIFGPRQVGKTTLLQQFLAKTKLKYLDQTGDNTKLQAIFQALNFEELVSLGKNAELLVIDEAQRIPNIGEGLKIIVDHVPGVKVVVTGSASFELAGQIGEPLTGRQITMRLFPIANLELKQTHGEYEIKHQLLPELLVYGSYPAVVAATDSHTKRKIVEEITNSFLLKDILELERVKGAKVLLDLLRLLAFQIG